MKILYNWEINLPLLLTFMLTVSNGIISLFLRIRKSRIDKILILEPLYPKAKYLIELPISQQCKIEYSNDDKIIEKIVKRQFSDFINDVDIYWSYYGKPQYPELENMSSEKKEEYIDISNVEYERFFNESFLNYRKPLSPACSYDNPESKRILDEIILLLQEKRSSFPREIRETIQIIESNPPEIVFNKYQAQLSHDTDYFLHNDIPFPDPYRTVLFQIRELYERYSRNIFKRVVFWIRENSWKIPQKFKKK